MVVVFFAAAGALAGAFLVVVVAFAGAFAEAFFVAVVVFLAAAGAFTPLGGAAEVMFFLGLRTLEVEALGLALVAGFAAAAFFSVEGFLGATFSLASGLALGASLTLPLGPDVYR